MNQKTIARDFQLKGIGLHSGQPSTLTVRSAPAGAGICFFINNNKKVPAVLASLSGTDRATTLNGVSVVEHFLSAAYGLGIDNLEAEVSGPELPILDGSALPFVDAFRSAGIIDQAPGKNYLTLSKIIALTEGRARLEAAPCDGFKLDFMVKFEGFGEQFYSFDAESGDYAAEIAPARTFGYLKDAEALKKQGLALGASPENALVLDKNGYVNRPRFPDELARHKILDLIGDLALLGRPLRAVIKANCSGHKLNTDLVRRILETERAEN